MNYYRDKFEFRDWLPIIGLALAIGNVRVDDESKAATYAIWHTFWIALFMFLPVIGALFLKP